MTSEAESYDNRCGPAPPARLRMTTEEQRILSKLDNSMHVNDEAWEIVSRLEDRGWIRGARITADGYKALYWYRSRSISA